MTSESFELRTTDGLILRGTKNEPVVKSRGLVVCVHGFGEHHRRHDLLAETLAEQGFTVFRYDQRGHGISGGSRGDSTSFEQLLHDLDLVLKAADEEFPNLPLFLYGHSLGGGIVANWAIQHRTNKPRGLILSSPWLELRKQPHVIVQWLGRQVASLWPTMTVKTGIRARNLASNPESMAKYRGDPLIVKRITLRMILGIMQAGRVTMQNGSRLDLPALVMHGTADRITSSQASMRLASSAPQVELKLFEGLAHEMHFEQRAPEVMQTIVDWLDRQLTSAGPECPQQ